MSIFIVCFFLCSVITPAKCSNNETDLQALLAFKKAIENDPNGALNSWNETVHFCSWQGISCSQRHQNRVGAIDLMSQGLVGPISPHVGNLSFLRSITLQNNSFYGQIPDEIGRLRRLERVELSNNSLSGEIPRNISQCTRIYYLNLIDNNLMGTIISELGNLRELEALGLSENQLSETIPPWIGNLTFLVSLSLSTCGIQGEIPESLGQLQYLELLNLDENNLTGRTPYGMYNISTIRVLSLFSNQLQGTIPSDIGSTLPGLRYLNLADNHLNGVIPVSLSNCSMLERVTLSVNNFTGQVLLDFGRLPFLGSLLLGYNHLEGDVSFISSMINCTRLQHFALSGNLLSGSLPASFSNLSSQLSYLAIGENQLRGSIPSGVGNLLGLTRLSIEDNDFEGPIPSVIGNLQRLQALYLGKNGFTNEIPFSFGNLTLLNELYLGESNLYGNIPPSLRNCSNLLMLDISSNNLNGSIPREIISLSSLSISLNLSRNDLSGSIPPEVGSLINLVILDLSHNGLSGSIPNSLSSCIRLERLYLEGNSLIEEIPDALRTLRGVQYLDLSQNNLSGTIPRYLGEFDLMYLNLSFNSLEGEVPTMKVFENVSAISLDGNSDLCGGIPSLNFPPCSSNVSDRKHFPLVFKIIIPVVIVGALCIGIASYFYIMHMRRVLQTNPSSMPSPVPEFPRLSYADLLKATDAFSETNLVGAGRFGSVYKGNLDDGHTLVAVKVLHLDIKGASKSFISECTALRGIRHRNLVKMVNMCTSTDFQGKDFKALVYDYMANGNLDDWLHQKVEEGGRILSFRQRLYIAIDIASALEYLHCGTESTVVHGDLKPSNILLDKNMTAHVGDFGLAKVISNILPTEEGSTVNIRGTIGYIPPEYGMSFMVSKEGDVYSYGILLLEMLTGRRPTGGEFNDNSNLRNFVRNALQSQDMEVLDAIILRDEHDYNTTSKIKNCVVSILEIGVACSEESPRDRPPISVVVNELKKIAGMFE